VPDATPPSGGALHRLPALLGSSDLVRAALDSVDVGIVACDADGGLVLVNEAARRFHGRGSDPSVRPEQWSAGDDLYRADGCTPLPLDEVPLHRALVDGAVRGVEVVIAPAGLPPVTVHCTGTALRDDAGRVTGAVCTMTDVTALRASEQRLRAAHDATARSEAQFRHAFERGPTPMCRLDADGVVQQLNPALRRLVARPTSSVLGRRLVSLVAAADREPVEICLAAAVSPELEVDSVEVRLRRPDETLVWVELAVSTSADEHGAPMLLVQLADVDARRRREEELERRASQDPLTGLPNRAALLRVLAERLAPSAGQRAPSLLFLDLDAFKQVNDDAGHAVGDEVLVEVARRLEEAVRPGDLVARLGGDEFVVVFDVGRYADQVDQELVGRVHEALRPPVMTSVGTRAVSASVGVGRAAIGEDPVAVLARADSAMYARKRRRGRQDPLSRRPGRNPVLQPRIAELLATAEQEDRLDLVYQPVVDLTTGRTVGAEALLRMRSRTGSVIGPDAFIPVAEATGDIHALGAWVLERACAQAAQWKAALPPGAEFGMGVNLSPRQLDDPRLLDRLDAALQSSGLDPDALVIELTERLLTADTDEVRRTLDGVRARGVHLACDDFGSGYASLRYLDELPIDLIKIDRSWTALLAGEGASSRLALGVLRLAQTSGLVVVAEGVETEVERDALRAEGCRLAQGYLFSRPDSAARLTEALGLPVPRQRAGEPAPAAVPSPLG
jgi:diguanylate cyclase (GGDEF)-like protein/PAS domain S-box-containing protein